MSCDARMVGRYGRSSLLLSRTDMSPSPAVKQRCML